MKFLILLTAVLPAPVEACSVKTVWRHDDLVDQGSGTVVAKDDAGFLVLTCRHAVGPDGRLTVWTRGGDGYDARFVRAADDADVALVRVDAREAHVDAAAVADSDDYAPGEKLLKAGYPAGSYEEAEGPACDFATRSPETGLVDLVAELPGNPGNSGGGVFRASDHALVGVAWGGKDGRLWATRLGAIQALLEKSKNGPGAGRRGRGAWC